MISPEVCGDAEQRLHWWQVYDCADLNTTPHLDTVSCYLTYEDSVLDHADHFGNLSAGDATKLLTDHGFSWDDVHADNHGVSWSHLEDRNAEALLAWLGY